MPKVYNIHHNAPVGAGEIFFGEYIKVEGKIT